MSGQLEPYIKTNGVWHYLKQDGVMATGWLRIDGVTQQFDASGKWISA